MNGKKRIFNSLALLLGLSLSSFTASSVHASNLHQEGIYDSGNVITYSLGNNHVESTAKRQTLRQENPFTPVFLLGESMGEAT